MSHLSHNNNAISPSFRLRQFRRICEPGSVSARGIQKATGMSLCAVRVQLVRYVAEGQIRRDNPGKNPGLYSTPPEVKVFDAPRLGIVAHALMSQPSSIWAYARQQGAA